MVGTIYGLHNGDGVIRYVGQTIQTLSVRMAGHRRDARRGNRRPVCDWIVKYGPENLHYVVLEQCDVSILDEREVYWIGQFENLLNLKPGGNSERGYVRGPQSPEHIAKRIRRGSEHHNYGVPHTDEWKAKVSASLKGRPTSDKQKEAASLTKRGEGHHSAKLTEPDVIAIRESDEPTKVLAERYDVTYTTIQSIRARKSWKHLP